MQSMRFVILLILQQACASESDHVTRQLEEARYNRWQMSYAPRIEAECRPDPESLRCAWVKREARLAFEKEEQDGEQMRGEAANQRFAAEQDQRRRERERRRVCTAIGQTVICN